jgi:hemophore
MRRKRPWMADAAPRRCPLSMTWTFARRIGQPRGWDGTIGVGCFRVGDHSPPIATVCDTEMFANRKELSMRTSPAAMRRGLYGVFATTALGGLGAAALALPSATAAPNPCAASEIARTIGSVSTNTGNYLDAHLETNTALTNATGQPGPQAIASLKTYFDANPQVSKDMQTIQQPLTGLSSQCKLPITVPQALGLMQAMSNGQATGQLPGATAPVAGAPAQVAPAAPATPVTGPLPGPAPSTTR